MKSKLIIAIAVLVLTVTIFLLLELHISSKKEVIERFRAGQIVAARSLAREIESYLHDRSRGVEILSTFTSFQKRDMNEIAATIKEYFEYLKKDHVKAVSVYDEKGTILYSTTKDAIGHVYAECDFFQWAAKKENKGKQLVSSLIRKTDDQTVQLPSFRFLIAAPIYQAVENPQHPKPSHNFIGVVTETIDLEEVIAAFLPLASPYAAKENVWIMDRDGTLLFQSEHPEMALKNIRSQDKTCFKCHVTFEHVETILNERQGTTEYQLKDKPKKLASYSSIEFKNISWTIVLNIPYEEVSGFINRNLILTFILIGIIAAVLIGGASLIYRSYRLKALAETEAQQLREKRALEEKIIEFEERYRKLVELLPDGIAIHCEGKIVFANSVIAGLVGASAPEELIGKEAIEMFPPENREVLIERFKRLLESGKRSLIIEDQILRMNGSVSNVDVSAMPISYQNKPAVLLIVHDITRLKRIEETLIRRAEIESAISYISKSMISIRDLDEVINEALEIIGLLAESGRSYIFLISKDGNNLTNTHEWCAQGVEPRKLNLQNIPCNTFPFWMERFHKNEVINISDVSAMPAEAEAEKEWLTMQNIKSVLVFPLSIANELAGFIGLDNVKSAGLWSEPDINILRTVFESIGIAIERKQSEEALIESEFRFRSVWEKGADGMIITDENGLIVKVNQAFCNFVKKPIEELEGNPLIEIYAESDRKRIPSSYLENYYYSNELKPSLERKFKLWNGEEVWFAVTNAFLNIDSPHKLVLSIFRDITEGKKKEEILKKSEATLREQKLLLDEKSSSLIEMVDRLTLSQSELEISYAELKANKDAFVRSEKLAFTGRIAASIAHEIRNPLTNVSLSVQQLKKGNRVKQEGLIHIDVVARNVERINFLITELLNCACPEKLNLQLYDVHKIINDVLDFDKTKIRLQKIKVTKNLTSKPSILKIDKEHIGRALLNLITNAIDAMPRGGNLTIITESNKDFFPIKINDTGAGIPEKDIIKIFDPFFSTKPKGFGLGLTTCYGIIVSHGGTIEVESKWRHGSTFSVYLPIEQELKDRE